MDSMVRDFALQMLRRLQSRKKIPPKASNGHEEGEEQEGEEQEGEEQEGAEQEERMDDEDGELPSEPEDLVQTPYLSEQIEIPARKAEVLQHVELLFALSRQVPEFLDEWVHYLSLVRCEP
jgi:symplekin